MGNRYALLIGNTTYEDVALAAAPAPTGNVQELAQVLQDPQVGGFQVTRLLDESRSVIERTLAQFFRKRERDDTLLLYFCGQAVLDDVGMLYLATRETERDLPDVTAISAQFISSIMDKSNSSRMLIALDCNTLGAFDPQRMSSAIGAPINASNLFRGTGYGRVVFTAADETRYAWDGALLLGDKTPSVLTQCVIEGLRTGDADEDRDGLITTGELFAYVQRQVRQRAPDQHPQQFTYGQEHGLIVARNPHSSGPSVVAPAAVADAAPDTAQQFGAPAGAPTPTSPAVVAQPSGTAKAPHTIFINYAAADSGYATTLANLLEKAGYAVWMDRKVLEGSDNWKLEIDRGLRNSIVLVAILTPHSVAPEREWVQYEQREAFELFLPIVPLLFEPCEPPDRLKRINYIDFQTIDDKAVAQLLRAIQKHVLRQGEQLFDEAPVADRTFIGRGSELRALHNLIMSDDLDATRAHPTLAIHGLAGSGKTMLLRELTRRMGRMYPGGVIYEQRGESSLPVQAVLNRWMAQALGSRPEQDASPQEVRAKLMQYGELLVAFDDVWAEDFPNVEVLIEALPPDTTRILTTQFRDEAAAIGCEIFPLEYPLEKLGDADALQFLKDRLQGKGPLPDDDLLLQLAHAVDGHPLALEISVGQCQYTGDLKEIVDELVDDLQEGVSALRYHNLLKVNVNTSVTMSFDRSLRALEAWDHESGTTYARAFHALGVFPDNVPLTRDIIGATWDEKRPRWLSEALSALVDRALLIRDMQGAANYRIHPLVRGYARELLHGIPSEYASAQRRYVRFIINRAYTTFQAPQTQWDDDETLVRHIIHSGRMLTADVRHALGAERFAALSGPQAVADPEPTDDPALDTRVLELTCGFVDTILPLLRERPELGDEVVSWLGAGLASARALNNARQASMFQKEVGAWYSRHSNYAQALEYLPPAVAVARQGVDLYLLAEALREQGNAEALADGITSAIAQHNEALTIHRALGKPEDIANTLIDLGHDYWLRADSKTALNLYGEALRINPQLSASAFNHIGSAYFVLAQYDNAIQRFQQGLESAKMTGSLRWEAENSNDVAAAYIGKGEYEQALPHLKRAIELYAKVGDRRVESIAYGHCSSCYLHLGQIDEAVRCVEKSLAIARDIHSNKAEVWAMHDAALLDQARGRFAEARTWYEDALRIIADVHLDDKRTEAGVTGDYAWLLFTAFSETQVADTLTVKALDLLNEIGLPSGEGYVTVAELQRHLDLMRGAQPGGAIESVSA